MIPKSITVHGRSYLLAAGPFRKNAADYEAYCNALLRLLMSHGCSEVMACGTNGETLYYVYKPVLRRISLKRTAKNEVENAS